MNANGFLSRMFIFGFRIAVGFALAKAIYLGSLLGILLALVSLGAGIYFIYLAAHGRKQIEKAGKIP